MSRTCLGPRLGQFLDNSTPNAWLERDGMAVYVRNAVHNVQPYGLIDTLDIANISVEACLRGSGMFSLWLKYAEQAAYLSGKTAVYVECVLNTRLQGHLERQGYKLVDPKALTPSLYKLCNQLQNI